MEKAILGTLGELKITEGKRTTPASVEPLKKEKRGSTASVAMLDLPDLSGIRPEEELRAEAEKVSVYLSQVRSTIRNILGVCRARPGSKDAEAAQAVLARILGVEDSGIRQQSEWFYAAEYISAAINHGIASIWEATRHLGIRIPGKDKDKEPRVSLIREVEEGKPSGRPFMFRFVFGRKIIVPNASFPDKPDNDLRRVVEEVFSGFSVLDKVSRERSATENAEKRKKLLEGASRSWEDLMDEVIGIYVVSVPEGAPRTIRSGQDAGKEVVDPRGMLRVKVVGKRVKPVGAVDRLEGSMRGIIDCGLSIPVRSIAEERLFLDAQTRRELPDPERLGMAYALHSALRRSFLARVEVEKKRRESEEMSADATMGHEQFLLDKADGKGFVTNFEFSDKGKEGPPYHHPGVLVERATGEIREIRLLKTNCPDLFKTVGNDWMKEGENFNGVKDPLGAFLRLAANKILRKRESGATVEMETGEEVDSEPEPERREIPVEGK